jgi:O-methyltransferase domain/Dimerisation domain
MTAAGDATLTRRLLELAEGYRITQLLAIAVRLEIAERLADGPRDTAELAEAAGVHEPSLFRLLRAFACLGLVSRVSDRRFGLTPLGACLAADHETSARARVLLHADALYDWWPDLLGTIRTGENFFQRRHGTDAWTFRAKDGQRESAFDDAMQEGSSQRARAVVAAYDFSAFSTVVDVGGGRGSLLARILGSYPSVSGVLFDQPHVVAAAPQTLVAAGVSDRCRVVAGSFFDGVPDGGDAYIMSMIIHDWDDDPAVKILDYCRHAMAPSGRLLLIERVVDVDAANALSTALWDLQMMHGLSGRERSEDEFRALFARAGFRLTRVVPFADIALIEAVPEMQT